MFEYAFVIAFVAWFLGGLVNGITGMGAAMIALPLMGGAIKMTSAVPASCLIVCVIAAQVAWRYRRYCLPHALTAMLVGSLPGIVMGSVVLGVVSDKILLCWLGVFLMAYTLWQFHGSVTRTLRSSATGSALAGFASGFTNASTSFSGPPVAIYALLVQWDKDTVRGTLGLFFFVMTVLTCIVQAFAGFFTLETLIVAASGLPGAVAGLVVSIPLAKIVSEKMFRHVLLLMILLAGLLSLYRGITAV